MVERGQALAVAHPADARPFDAPVIGIKGASTSCCAAITFGAVIARHQSKGDRLRLSQTPRRGGVVFLTPCGDLHSPLYTL